MPYVLNVHQMTGSIGRINATPITPTTIETPFHLLFILITSESSLNP